MSMRERRHRLDQMRDAGILSQSATMLNDGSTVEKRYKIEDEHRETAETVREALAITGGDLGNDPGAEEFYAVVDEIRDVLGQINDLETESSLRGDGADDLEARVDDCD